MVQILFFIIIGILVFEFLLDQFLEYLDQAHWKSELPVELKDIYDENEYKKSREYDKVNYKFGLVSGTFGFVLVLLMILSGGFNILDEFSRSMGDNLFTVSLLFFGILFFFNDILTLPFSIYHTFIIEEKFGFNKTTVKTFIMDILKGYLLSIIIGGGLLCVFIWFYQWAGTQFWIYFWVTAVIFMVFMQLFYTSLILPLFNKLTPLADGELRTAIENYAKGVEFPLTNIYVIDGSKRSTKANAFFSGLGPKKKIVLFDTLIKDQSVEELVAVLAHEVGHFKKKHTLQGMAVSVLQTGLMLYLLSWFIDEPSLSLALGAKQGSFYMGLLAFGILYSPVSMILGLFMNMVSRKNEFEADAYAATTFNGKFLQSALKKLSVKNLSNLNPHPLYVFFHYSHPTLLQRLKAINRNTGIHKE